MEMTMSSPEKTFGEDLHFISRVLKAGVRVHHFADATGDVT